MNLKKQVFNSIFWNGLANVLCQGVNVAISLALARLLYPQDFGIMGMAAFLVGFVSFFSEFGIGSALIQKNDLDEESISSIFWSAIMISALLYGLVFLIAPLYAAFYHEPRLTLIIRVLFIDFLIYPTAMVQYAIHVKRLEYKTISLITIVSTTISGIVSVIMAFSGCGVWSLIAQPLISRVLSNLFFWIYTDWKPAFICIVYKIKASYGFGLRVLLSNLVSFLVNNIDYFLIGKFLGTYTLGIYTLAFRIMKAPFNKIAGAVTNILFSAYLYIQDEEERFNKNYLRCTTAISCLIVPFLIYISFNAKDLILILVGEKWIDSAPILSILCAAEMMDILLFSDQSAISAKGQPGYLVTANVIILVFLGFSIFYGSRYGIIVVSIAYTICIFIGASIKKLLMLRKLHIPFHVFLRAMRPVIVVSLSVAGISLTAAQLFTVYSFNIWARMGISSLFCAAAYLIALIKAGIIRFEQKKMHFNI